MADTVFRVEVGANIMTSTATLKRDIDNMLNKISQNQPPTIVVGLQKEATKQQIQKDLNNIFNSSNSKPYGITIRLDGGNDINGATGRALKKDILAITDTLSRSRAAKITVHIDTNATQKAMVAELKKLNLGVTITPKDGSGGEKGFAEYNKNLQTYANRMVQVKTLEKQLTNSSLTQNGRNTITQEIAVWTARAEAARTAALNTTYAKNNNIDAKQFEDAANAMEKMQKAQTSLNIAEKQQIGVDDKKNRKVAQDEYNKSLQKYITLMAQANKARARAITSEKGSPERAQYNQEASDLSRLAIAERDAFLRGSSANVIGVDARVYTDTANAANKLAQSKYRLAEAQNAYNKARDRENTSIDSQIDTAKSKLNIGTSEGLKWAQNFENLRATLKATGASAQTARSEIAKLGREAKAAGAMAESAWERFSRMLGNRIGYGAIALGLMKVNQALRQVYTNVVAIDTGMTELKKVTDETDETYRKFLDNAAVRAKILGATISNTINATASFARLGYSLNEAAQLADAAVVYEHVGDEIDSIDEASNSVISTMQAFGIEAKDVMTIVDKFNQIGNTMPISSGGVGEAMQRSAASLKAANNTIDESLALIASMNAVVQNPESVGTTLKTVSMYLRAAKTEAEAAGESTDGMANSVSELRSEIKALTGNKVDIMIDADGTTFKSTYQILKEISQVWNQISDVSQANILEKLAGKRNANSLYAVIQNFDIAEKALAESQNAAGSALAENEKYLDSINGKLDQLKASWEQLSVSVLNSEVVKGLIDLVRSLIEVFNRFDKATNGASSSVLALITIFSMGRAVFSAFKFQVRDTTTMIGALWGALTGNGDTAGRVTIMASAIQNLQGQLWNLSTSYNLGRAYTNSFIGGLKMAIKAISPLIIKTALLVAGIAALYTLYKHNNVSFDEFKEKSDSLKQELDELSNSLETNKNRIRELTELGAKGDLSITEQDELDRLNAQNKLLENQISLKQTLLDIAQQETAKKAREDINDFFDDTKISNDLSGGSRLDTNSMAQFERYKAMIAGYDQKLVELQERAKTATGDTAAQILDEITEIENRRSIVVGKMSSLVDPLVTMMDSLNPQTDSALIDKIQTLVYQVQYLSDDATALSNIWNDLWNDETRFPGITKFKEQLIAAATAQKSLNDEMSQYDGNVDYTNRPHVTVTQDLVDTGFWSPDELGMYSTVHSVTYKLSDFGIPSTGAVVVTPMLPDGTPVENEDDMYKYLRKIFGDGEFHPEEDELGIIMGVVDEGSVDDSLAKAAEIESKAHEVNAWYHDLMETDQWKQISEAFAEIGIDLSQYPAGELAEMFERLGVSAELAEKSMSGLAEALDSLTEKMDLLKNAQEEYNTYGALSASTLSDIAEKFPELEESIGLYVAGMKSGKDLLKDLSAAYQTDVTEYKNSMIEKLASSNAFYNSLSDKQKQSIKDLASSYDVDLRNFKTIEAAKLDFQAQIIQKLAMNYSKYTGKTLEQLKAYRNSLDNSAWKENNPEYQALTEAIKVAESFNTNMDDIISGKLETWSPTTFKDNSKSSSSSSDEYKKSVDEKINALKHQLAMEKITSEQYYNGLEAIENQYYKDSAAHLKKYVDEIRSIDEELFDGRRELNEGWLNDQQDFAERAGSGGDYSAQQDYYNGMYSKLQEMIKAAKNYGLDESSDYVQELYDKVDQLQSDILASVKASFENFESYMDDFDLWKGSDFSKLDYLKHELNEIIALYNKGQLSWTQYTDARNEIARKMYDTQRDSLEEILDLTMDMIKQEAEDQVDALEKQVDAYQKIIDKKKELLQDSADEADHEEQVAEKVKEIAELQSKIAQLSLDDSREATAKKSSLEQDLYTAQKELADLQRDYSLDQTLDALDKTQEAFEDEKDAEKDAVKESVDSWQKLYEKAIKRIEGDWSSLYDDLTEYQKTHRDSIDGPDSLVTAWKNATTAMQEYNNSFEDAYNNAGINAIDPTKNQTPEAQAILQKMNNNSALAKALGTSKIGTPGTAGYRDLHQENIDYAQQYYELTGQKLTYDSTAGWKYDNGTSGNTINSSTQNTVKKDSSSGGSAYEATKTKYSMDAPSGTLKEGVSKGKDVEWLQYYLKQLGYFTYAVDGQFYSRTKKALEDFQRDHDLNPDGIYGPATRKKIPLYHTGGIVGNAGSINDTEVLALLKKGEWVLDDQRKQNLKSLFAGLKEAASGMMSATVRNRMQTMHPAAVTAGGDTFAPHIEVSIQHNGSMSDKDAKQYGNMVANTALEQLKSAFAKRGKF